MTGQGESVPPRPLRPGDVVAAFCEPLGEWAAAQVTALRPDWESAELLELDWSGPEPAGLAGLGELRPLRKTYGGWGGRLAHCHYDWLLPRNCKVIGNLPVLVDRPSDSSALGCWRIGRDLAAQRRWDDRRRGARQPERGDIECTGDELMAALSEPGVSLDGVWGLAVKEVTALDCGLLAARYPALTDLWLAGDMGSLADAGALNRLGSLKRLSVVGGGLFGMTAADCLLPERVPALEWLLLHSIPVGYATAMRNRWRPLAPDGTCVRISCGRSPQWVAENRDNPLRCWDGREYITGAQYRKAVSQYKTTRRAIVAALAEEDTPAVEDRLIQAGREYAEAFNTLGSRTHFIETMEREELFDALEVLVKGLADHTTLDLAQVIEAVEDGMDQTRNWLRQPAKAAAATAPVRTRPQHPAQTPDFLPTRDAISAQVRQRMGRAPVRTVRDQARRN
jgi:hypothetical protein